MGFVFGPHPTARRPDEMVTSIVMLHRDAANTLNKLRACRCPVTSISLNAVPALLMAALHGLAG